MCRRYAPRRGISIPKQEYADVYDRGKKKMMGEIQVLPVAEKYPYQQGAPDDIKQKDERQPYADEGPPAGRAYSGETKEEPRI